jgi:hypothetical protein
MSIRRPLLAALAMTSVLSGCAFATSHPARFLAHDRATVDGDLYSTRTFGTYSFWFEYGRTTAYGNIAGLGTISVGIPNDQFDIPTKLTGLDAGETYHYRLCATDQDNPNYPGCSADRSFTTPTTTGPYLTINPSCINLGRRTDGIDVTGTGFPPSTQDIPGPFIGEQVSFNGAGFLPGRSGRALNAEGDIDFGVSEVAPGTVVELAEVRTFLDPNFNGILDPGEQVLATGSLSNPCPDS